MKTSQSGPSKSDSSQCIDTERIFVPESDYGLDWETEVEAEVDEILCQLDQSSQLTNKPVVVSGTCNKCEHTPNNALVNLTCEKASSAVKKTTPSLLTHVNNTKACCTSIPRKTIHQEVLTTPEAKWNAKRTDLSRQVTHDLPLKHSTLQDSPLQRFRSVNQKALSVTDLVSPSWCELQYFFSLSKYGKIKQTKAMQRGTVSHKELEEEIFETVSITVKTREEEWALLLWNVVQGLRTLRETGLTRELWVWGVIGDQVVNGVIDELFKPSNSNDSQNEPIFCQTIKHNTKCGVNDSESYNTVQSDEIFIKDVKTRVRDTIPSEVSARATKFQLMLYRKLLQDLKRNYVDSNVLFQRFRLSARKEFSSQFIQQLNLHHLPQESLDKSDDDWSEEEPWYLPSKKQSFQNQISQINCLENLWKYMIYEFQKTFSHNITISDKLYVEYKSQSTGAIIGIREYVYDEKELYLYLNDVLSWWKGYREAKGVDIEEAFKCEICEFADECEWRRSRATSLAAKNHQA